MEYRPIKDLTPLEGNPRTITDKDFKKLVKSISENKEFFEARPCILSDRTGKLVIIAGNQRYHAAVSLGREEVPTYLIKGLTEAKEREIIIRDNVNNGVFDWDILANSWDMNELKEWGVEIPLDITDEEDDEKYTKEITTPDYEAGERKPAVSELYDDTKSKELLDKIRKNTELPSDIRTFLEMAALRHMVFDYRNIADFYAHADEQTQELMEDSALVIIDFDKAIENGYVKVSKDLAESYLEDHPDAE